jgi:hypothetical protein
MSSGQSWTRGAESPGPGQRRIDDNDREAPQADNRGAWDRGGESAPRERSIDDSGLLGLRRDLGELRRDPGELRRDPGEQNPESRSRWRDLGRSTRREQPTASYEQLGEDDYWSYLRGDRELGEPDQQDRPSFDPPPSRKRFDPSSSRERTEDRFEPPVEPPAPPQPEQPKEPPAERGKRRGFLRRRRNEPADSSPAADQQIPDHTLPAQRQDEDIQRWPAEPPPWREETAPPQWREETAPPQWREETAPQWPSRSDDAPRWSSLLGEEPGERRPDERAESPANEGSSWPSTGDNEQSWFATSAQSPAQSPPQPAPRSGSQPPAPPRPDERSQWPGDADDPGQWAHSGATGGFWPDYPDDPEETGRTGSSTQTASPPPEPPEWSVRRRLGAASAGPGAGPPSPAPPEPATDWQPPELIRRESLFTAPEPAPEPPTLSPSTSTRSMPPVPPAPPSFGPLRSDPPGVPGPVTMAEPDMPADPPDRRNAWAAVRRTMADPVTGQQPAVDVEPPPAWRKLIRSGRQARVRPGIVRPVALTVLAGLVWLAVVGYGVLRLDLMWSVAALVVGAAGLALALRGRSVIGLLPVLLGAGAWGMATGSKVPDSFSNLQGDLKLVAWNVVYAVPLLIAYGFATWVDGSRYARDRVSAVLGDRRWFGAADVPDAEPGIAVMETVPSARFFQLAGGSSPHMVTAGRRVALVRSTVWPPGEYTVTDVGEVHRNGRIYANGSDDLNGMLADMRTWAERLESVAPHGMGFLVVHPASARSGDKVDIDIPETRGIQVIPANQFVPVVGEYLAGEPYRIDVALTERLGEYLPIFEPAEDKAPVG